MKINWKNVRILFFLVFAACLLPFNSAKAVEQDQEKDKTPIVSDQDVTSNEEKVELPKVTLKISKAKAKSVTLKWNKIKNVKKYYVLRSTKKKSGYKKIATVKNTANQYTNAKLKENKTYYYKVQAVLTDGKKITSNIKTKVKVRGSYKPGSVYGPSLSQKQLNLVKDYVANFVNVYTDPGMDDFYKVLFAHDYLCNHCSYQTKGWHVNYANTALGALKYKKAQCSGYARGFKALCDGMGVGCRYIHANNKAMNPSHQWNLVKVDKKWYLIDVQLNDSSGGYFCFLIGSNTSKNYFGDVYRYDTKGTPSLSKKDYDFQKYFQ